MRETTKDFYIRIQGNSRPADACLRPLLLFSGKIYKLIGWGWRPLLGNSGSATAIRQWPRCFLHLLFVIKVACRREGSKRVGTNQTKRISRNVAIFHPAPVSRSATEKDGRKIIDLTRQHSSRMRTACLGGHHWMSAPAAGPRYVLK